MDFFKIKTRTDVDPTVFQPTRKKTKRSLPAAFRQKSKIRVREVKAQDQDNITMIHEKVLRYFEDELHRIQDLEQQKNDMRWIQENGMSRYEKNQAGYEIERIDNEIREIKEEKEKKRYLSVMRPLLNQYYKIISKPIKINFLSNAAPVEETEKEEVTNTILDLAEKYIPIERDKKTKKEVSKCNGCGGDDLQMSDGQSLCLDCGLIDQVLTTTDACFKDIDRVNTSSRYEYDRHTHFRDEIRNMTGTQNVRIKPEVYDILRKCIEQNQISMDKLTPDNLLLFMKENRLAKCYEHIYLIFKELTGRSCSPDINKYEAELLERHEMILKIWNEVKPPGKKNFINARYVLIQMLRQLGWEPHRTAFSVLKTREKLIEHDQIWKKICERLNSPTSEWIFYPTV